MDNRRERANEERARRNREQEALLGNKPDERGTAEKIADETLTAGTSASLAVPAIIGSSTKIPFFSRGMRFLGSPKLAALAGGYAIGNALENKFDLSGKIAEGYDFLTGGGAASRPAITEEEKRAYAQSINPVKPIGQEPIKQEQTQADSRRRRRGRRNVGREVDTPEGVSAPTAPTAAPAAPAAPVTPVLAPPAPPANAIQQSPILDQPVVPFETPNIVSEALAPRGELLTDEQLREPGSAQGAYAVPALERGADPRIMGVSAAPTAEDPGATQTQEISMDDLRNLEALQAQQGTPVISGEPAPGLKPFIDASGNVAFGDANTAARMNAMEGQRKQEERAAQQRAIQSIASRGAIPQSAQENSPQANFLKRLEQGPLTEQEIAQGQAMAQSMGTTFDPETGYSRDAFLQDRASPRAAPSQAGGGSFEQASRDREARLAAKPDFNEVRRGQSPVGKDGLTDAQRRKAYSDPEMRARSKAGLLGNVVQQKQLELDALKVAEREDPTKFEYNQQVVMEIVNNLPAINPDTGKAYTAQEKRDIYRQYMYEIAIQKPMYDKFGDIIPNTKVAGFGIEEDA